jgi:hypothetical protein
MSAMVELRDVTRTFGAVTAVDTASLTVAPGEIVGLLGANGAGKTTLVRILLGLLAPTSGAVRLFGAPPTRASRRRLGYVPQGLGLYTDLTVAENLAFYAAAFGVEPPALDGDLGTAAEGVPVERRDHRHAEGGKPLEDTVAEAHPLVTERCGIHAAPGLDVAAGGKGLALAGQDDDAHSTVRLDRVAGGSERLQHIDVEGIEFFGPRHGHDGDRAFDLNPNALVSHARLPQFSARPSPAASDRAAPR